MPAIDRIGEVRAGRAVEGPAMSRPALGASLPRRMHISTQWLVFHLVVAQTLKRQWVTAQRLQDAIQ